jgi:hypothetical protein
VQQHAASFIAHTGASTGREPPRFIKDEFDAFLECGILANGFRRLRCGECGHDKLLAFSCKRRLRGAQGHRGHPGTAGIAAQHPAIREVAVFGVRTSAGAIRRSRW